MYVKVNQRCEGRDSTLTIMLTTVAEFWRNAFSEMNKQIFLQGTETIRALECTIYILVIFFNSVSISSDFYFKSTLITNLML